MSEALALGILGALLAAGMTGAHLVRTGREQVGCCPPGTAYIILGFRHWWWFLRGQP